MPALDVRTPTGLKRRELQEEWLKEGRRVPEDLPLRGLHERAAGNKDRFSVIFFCTSRGHEETCPITSNKDRFSVIFSILLALVRVSDNFFFALIDDIRDLSA